MIIIRNETGDDIVLKVGDEEVEILPNKFIQVTPEQFDILSMEEHIVKFRNGVIKIKGLN